MKELASRIVNSEDLYSEKIEYERTIRVLKARIQELEESLLIRFREIGEIRGNVIEKMKENEKGENLEKRLEGKVLELKMVNEGLKRELEKCYEIIGREKEKKALKE